MSPENPNLSFIALRPSVRPDRTHREDERAPGRDGEERGRGGRRWENHAGRHRRGQRTAARGGRSLGGEPVRCANLIVTFFILILNLYGYNWDLGLVWY